MYSLSSSSATSHTTNFNKLVELVVSCGGETLQTFLDSWRKCNIHLKTDCSRVCECSLNVGGECLLKRLALEDIYETSHEPEALGLSKALSSHSTIAAVNLLDYSLPQVAKLSCAL